LHHLEGIPRQTSVLKNKIKVDLCFSLRSQRAPRWNCNAGYDTRASQHAIVPVLSFLNRTCDCLVRPIRQFVCFTPAFIFARLSRGPPIFQRETFLESLIECNRETLFRF
jgi:hypothetical protein